MTHRLSMLRAGTGLLGLVIGVLMFGPFQGLEERLGFSDKAAHGIAFYVLTLGVFLCLPHNRRTDLGLGVIAVAAASELIQFLVGRSMSFADFAADASGILAAMLPATIERVRRSTRMGARRATAAVPA